MMNLRLGAAFFAVTLTLLVFLQLLGMIQHTSQVPASGFTQSFNQWRSRASAATNKENLFLVGAGKADVTGYSISFYLILSHFISFYRVVHELTKYADL